MSINRIKIAEYSDERGSLDVVEFARCLPFKVERMFWISRVPEGSQRGKHAHWTCHEAVFAASGEARLMIDDGLESEYITLHAGDDGVFIPAGAWCELSGFSSDAVLVVLASEPFDSEGYCHDHEEWLARVKKCKNTRFIERQ